MLGRAVPANIAEFTLYAPAARVLRTFQFWNYRDVLVDDCFVEERRPHTINRRHPYGQCSNIAEESRAHLMERHGEAIVFKGKRGSLRRSQSQGLPV